MSRAVGARVNKIARMSRASQFAGLPSRPDQNLAWLWLSQQPEKSISQGRRGGVVIPTRQRTRDELKTCPLESFGPSRVSEGHRGPPGKGIPGRRGRKERIGARRGGFRTRSRL
eukprot:9329808-Pyramimonas_sp.AAC.1